jgi:hypothetical protein
MWNSCARSLACGKALLVFPDVGEGEVVGGFGSGGDEGQVVVRWRAELNAGKIGEMGGRLDGYDDRSGRRDGLLMVHGHHWGGEGFA